MGYILVEEMGYMLVKWYEYASVEEQESVAST